MLFRRDYKMANEEHDESRRKFLKNSGYAAGGFVGGGLLFGLIDNPFKSSDEDATKNDQAERKFEESRMFFTRYKDFQVLDHATERIFPEDDNGPGAIKLGVPYFIDKQLAGDFGSNKKDYMQGPVHRLKDREESIDTYQSLMNRGQVFIEGLRKINAESESRHKIGRASCRERVEKWVGDVSVEEKEKREKDECINR